MEDVLIRYEYNRIIIWSNKFKSYFCTTNDKNENDLRKFLDGYRVSENFERQCKEIGLDGKRRELHSQNKLGLMSPLEYYFDFTTACNLRCRHCYNRFKLGHTTMSKEQIKDIITDMYNSGVMRLHLAGGEPTLFLPEMETYLKTAQQYGIFTSMASNGTLITDELCYLLDKYQLFSITISLEAANEKKNALVRGEGSFAKAIEGIKKLTSYKKSYGSSYLVGIKVSYDVDFTREDFEELIKLAIDLNVDVIKFANPERCIFHERGYYGKNAEKYYKNIEAVQELKEKYNDRITITQINSPINNCLPIGLPETKGCIGAQELIAIAPDGKITPCLMNEYNLGNIKDYNSIKKLYLSAEIQEYYKLIRNYNCEQCEYHSQCRGGCQVRKFVEYGKIENKDPLCPIKYKSEQCKKYVYPLDKVFHKISVLHSL